MSHRTNEIENRDRRLRFDSRPFLTVAVLLVLLSAGMLIAGCSQPADGAEKAEAESAESASADGETPNGEDSEEGDEGEDEKPPVPVDVAAVKVGTIASYITSTANLVAENEVMILAEAEGRVVRLYTEEGQTVKRGQVLAELVPNDKQISRAKAELKRDNARLAYERAVDLYEQELISREEFDRLSMESQISEQELAEADWTLSKTRIRAPFSGRLTSRTVQVGQHVRPGDELFQVTDFDPLIARVFLPEKDVLDLEEGREVRIHLNARPEVAFTGRIRQISPIVDTQTGTVKVTVEASSPPTEMRPGSFVTLNVVRTEHADALLVPRDAVIRELKRAHVFVLSGEEAKRRSVTLGLEEDDWIESLGGLEPGDRVIVAGQGGLKDGAKVKVLGDEPESAG